MKRSAAQEQTLNLNRIDFERAGTGRKAGYKFLIEFTNGKVSNLISSSDLARTLATVLLENEMIKLLLLENNYAFSLNTKFQLHIKNCMPQPDSLLMEIDKEEA